MQLTTGSKILLAVLVVIGTALLILFGTGITGFAPIEIKEVNVSFNVRDLGNENILEKVEIYKDGDLIESTEKVENLTLEEGTYDFDIKPKSIVKSIRFKDIHLEKDVFNSLRLDEFEPYTSEDIVFKKIYFVDPVDVEFDKAVITSVATSSELYKCEDWGDKVGMCVGEWVKIKDVIPGEEYSFEVTRNDPGFGEGKKKKKAKVSFDRNPQCHKCGKHKAPPLTDVNMSISAKIGEPILNATFSDYYPNSWEMIDENGGTITKYNETYYKISWYVGDVNESIFRWYIIKSPKRTLPPTNYYFQSELNEHKSAWWRIIVADPPDLYFRMPNAYDDGLELDFCTNDANMYAYDGAYVHCDTDMSAQPVPNYWWNGTAQPTHTEPIYNATFGVYMNCTFGGGNNEYYIRYGFATTPGDCSTATFYQIMNDTSHPCPWVFQWINVTNVTTVTWDNINNTCWSVTGDKVGGGDDAILEIDGVHVEVSYAPPNVPPQWNNNFTNDTYPSVNDYVLHSVNWSDDTNLAGYIFSWNATGNCDTWANDSWVSMIGSPNQSNITKQIPSNCASGGGKTIGWYVWANDSNNAANMTGTELLPFKYNVTPIADGAPPEWSNNQTNNTYPNKADVVLHSVYWDDSTTGGSNLDKCYLEWNATGSDVNISSTTLSGVSSWCNLSATIPASASGKLIRWRQYVNDTSSNMNITDWFYYQVNDLPQIFSEYVNVTDILYGDSACFYANVTDSDTIDEVIATINATNYSMTNDTPNCADVGGDRYGAYFTPVGVGMFWMTNVYANDTYGAMNMTTPNTQVNVRGIIEDDIIAPCDPSNGYCTPSNVTEGYYVLINVTYYLTAPGDGSFFNSSFWLEWGTDIATGQEDADTKMDDTCSGGAEWIVAGATTSTNVGTCVWDATNDEADWSYTVAQVISGTCNVSYNVSPCVGSFPGFYDVASAAEDHHPATAAEALYANASMSEWLDHWGVSTPDTQEPFWSYNQTNDTNPDPNDYVIHSVWWNDSRSNLDVCVFEWNASGTYENTTGSVSGQESWCNVTKQIPEVAAGTTVYWRQYVNDTETNMNRTDWFTYPVTPPVIIFIIELPGNRNTTANSTGNYSEDDIWFNSSWQGNDKNVSACVENTADCQNGTIPIFRFWNMGNMQLNWTVFLNESITGVIKVFADTDNDTVGATDLSTTPWLAYSYIPLGASRDVWIWANFTNALPSDSAIRYIKSNSTQSVG